MKEEIRRFKDMVEASRRIVFFGGAGVSTESGIPDFRSTDGLYNQNYRFNPETILSRDFFDENPEEFFRFYHDKLVFPDARPNAAHYALARLEREGKLTAVITQNIDGLHQAAGSKNVLEIHGSLQRCYCIRCGKRYGKEHLDAAPGIPRCDCGGIVRPDIVFYQEMLDEQVLSDAVEAIRAADMLIVGGTSLVVYPAAGLINYFRGSRLALINRSETPYDDAATIVIREKIGEVFSQL